MKHIIFLLLLNLTGTQSLWASQPVEFVNSERDQDMNDLELNDYHKQKELEKAEEKRKEEDRLKKLNEEKKDE